MVSSAKRPLSANAPTPEVVRDAERTPTNIDTSAVVTSRPSATAIMSSTSEKPRVQRFPYSTDSNVTVPGTAGHARRRTEGMLREAVVPVHHDGGDSLVKTSSRDRGYGIGRSGNRREQTGLEVEQIKRRQHLRCAGRRGAIREPRSSAVVIRDGTGSVGAHLVEQFVGQLRGLAAHIGAIVGVDRTHHQFCYTEQTDAEYHQRNQHLDQRETVLIVPRVMSDSCSHDMFSP